MRKDKLANRRDLGNVGQTPPALIDHGTRQHDASVVKPGGHYAPILGKKPAQPGSVTRPADAPRTVVSSDEPQPPDPRR
eukprot:381717-Pyramimonas_sp.AAC.1